MTFNREELKKLALPAIAGLTLLVVGAALIWSAGDSRRAAQQELSAAQADRMVPILIVPSCPRC